ncbi:TonB-dependent receptor [Mucilaginibacter myungsuensis]|uniref:TonB-dependent receptor n=1 Tax=Mucilaginibacter myungsuensis TaxID=649104 RepID=A0A929KY39_9SPHI|nr:TonB-dependent receptor [Mucilaginibacter myungsuensis]MBE9662650.1 TonB-dependent receptor [Mucilaginibacter myungsuensis]MDN3598070.1 TonB-dependent receptor [Mucilaginibacter myungsuensis]
MKKRALSLIAITFILFSFTVADEPLDKLLAALEKLTADAPQEKVHLHLDKPFYSLGEDIWFKGYVVNADGTLSGRSKILYIDLLDDRDSVKKTILLPVVNGSTSGNIHLSDSTLSAGNYHIYAYTKWMLNFGGDFLFKKTVPVISPLHGVIRSSIQYSNVVQASGKQLNAQISYLTDNSKPYGNQPLTYTVQVNGKEIASGKGITSADGTLRIAELIKNDNKNANIFISTRFGGKDSDGPTYDFTIKPLAGAADVQFFPEGGHFVNGLRTKVAFKALKPDGFGEDIKGYITDGGTEHLAEFSSEHAGMGVFALQPQSGKTYTAVVTHQDGSESKHILPAADESGYVLNINRVGKDSVSVRIAASPAFANGREVAIVAQSNGVTQFVAKSKLEQASTVSIVSTKKFPTGIAHFTLFSPDMQPVAERLVFVDHNDHLNAAIAPDKPTYAKRGKVKLDVTVTDALNEPVIGSFSMSVTDASKVRSAEDEEMSIFSDLLLTSDIKGYVEQPNYYFNPANADRLKHLDQLLLTQGWRRFTWTDVIAGKLPVIKYQPEQSLTVSGLVTTLGNKPVAKGHVTLFGKISGETMIIDTVADDKGRFVFADMNFDDSTKLVVRGSNAKDRNSVKILIDKKPRIPYAAGFSNGNVPASSLDDYLKYSQLRFDELAKFGQFVNSIGLREVKVKARRDYFAERIIPNSSNISPGSADQVIKAEKVSQQTNLLNVFYGLAGIEVKNNMVYRIGRISSITRSAGVPMMVILDGATIEASMLKDIPPFDVAGIELLTSGSNTVLYGDQGAWGVIIITTKRGTGLGSVANAMNVAHYVPSGYAVTRQFYSPQYDTPTQNKMADLRSTIYWDADIITDAQGKAGVSYFNADDPGTYKVTLEGMDTKGKFLRKTITYKVE